MTTSWRVVSLAKSRVNSYIRVPNKWICTLHLHAVKILVQQLKKEVSIEIICYWRVLRLTIYQSWKPSNRVGKLNKSSNNCSSLFKAQNCPKRSHYAKTELTYMSKTRKMSKHIKTTKRAKLYSKGLKEGVSDTSVTLRLKRTD